MNEIPQRLTDITYLKNLAWSVHSSCMSGDNKCLWYTVPQAIITGFLG